MNNYYNTCIDDLDGEVWIAILGYDSKYYVSNKARVKSLKFHQPIILSQQVSTNGYLRVELWRDGKRKNCAVSRLVAEAFVPNDDPINKTTVDHRDRNKLNNYPENLQWLSRGDNVREYFKNKALPSSGSDLATESPNDLECKKS